MCYGQCAIFDSSRDNLFDQEEEEEEEENEGERVYVCLTYFQVVKGSQVKQHI